MSDKTFDHSPVPTLFTAATRKKYSVPFVKSGTSPKVSVETPSFVVIHLPALPALNSITKSVIGVVPSYVGSLQSIPISPSHKASATNVGASGTSPRSGA